MDVGFRLLIFVKPGDWLSKFSAAMYTNFDNLDKFVRPGPDGTPAEIPEEQRDRIEIGEAIIR